MWHLCKLSILPLVALIAGVTSLYVDPKENRNGKKILLAVLLLGAVGSIVMAFSDDIDKQHDQARSEQENRQLEQTVLNQSQTLSTIRGRTEDILARLSTFGLAGPTLREIRNSVSADEARSSLLPQLRQKNAGRQITVLYFPKQVDGPIVINALQEGGLNVRTGVGNEANKDLPTNAIWVGDAVSIEDTRFVALTLVRAGVKINSIRRFREGTGSKANLIEVGTDSSLLGHPALTVEDIQNLQQVTRDAG